MHADALPWPRLAAAVVVPAAAAGLIAALVFGNGSSPRVAVLDTSSPHLLSRVADVPAPQGVPPLRSIVIRGGRPVLGRDASAPAGIGAARPAPPARITIRAVGLAARVVPVSATSTGIAVPPPGSAGWYDGGPRPGEPGRSVLIGHVDDIGGHLASFGRIGEVRNGARIKLTDTTGRVRAFEVVGRAEVHKSAFPSADVYGASTHPVLVLITCGGPWLGRALGYRDNILVYARAVS